MRQRGRGVFLTVRPYGFTPKHRNARPDGLKFHFLQFRQVFWFLFWFYGDFTHVADDVGKPDDNAD